MSDHMAGQAVDQCPALLNFDRVPPNGNFVDNWINVCCILDNVLPVPNQRCQVSEGNPSSVANEGQLLAGSCNSLLKHPLHRLHSFTAHQNSPCMWIVLIVYSAVYRPPRL